MFSVLVLLMSEDRSRQEVVDKTSCKIIFVETLWNILSLLSLLSPIIACHVTQGGSMLGKVTGNFDDSVLFCNL